MARMDAILNSISSSEQLAETTELSAKTPAERGGKDSYLQLVPAVDQSIRLLFALANTVGGEASLTHLAKAVGISKSKGLAILNTLRNAGLVDRDDRSKNYSLGPNLLLLSRALLNNTDLSRAATPFENWLQDRLQRAHRPSARLCCRRPAACPGGGYIPIDGHRYPLTWGAHGRAYLATLLPEDLERRLSQSSILRAGETDRDGIDRDTLREQVEESRRLGYGKSLGTTWSGLNAVSSTLTIDGDGPGAPGRRHVVGCLVAVGSFTPNRPMSRLAVDRDGCADNRATDSAAAGRQLAFSAVKTVAVDVALNSLLQDVGRT